MLGAQPAPAQPPPTNLSLTCSIFLQRPSREAGSCLGAIQPVGRWLLKRSNSEIARRAIGRPGVKVPTRRRDRRVAEGRLDQMDWCAAFEAVRRVSMAEPMSGHARRQPDSHCRRLHDPMNLSTIKRATLPRAEDGAFEDGRT